MRTPNASAARVDGTAPHRSATRSEHNPVILSGLNAHGRTSAGCTVSQCRIVLPDRVYVRGPGGHASMSSTIPLPPGEQLCNRYCSNKQQRRKTGFAACPDKT